MIDFHLISVRNKRYFHVNSLLTAPPKGGPLVHNMVNIGPFPGDPRSQRVKTCVEFNHCCFGRKQRCCCQPRWLPSAVSLSTGLKATRVITSAMEVLSLGI